MARDFCDMIILSACYFQVDHRRPDCFSSRGLFLLRPSGQRTDAVHRITAARPAGLGYEPVSRESRR
jgi:hypothetical protein